MLKELAAACNEVTAVAHVTYGLMLKRISYLSQRVGELEIFRAAVLVEFDGESKVSLETIRELLNAKPPDS
jgi:hypothetical protein